MTVVAWMNFYGCISAKPNKRLAASRKKSVNRGQEQSPSAAPLNDRRRDLVCLESLLRSSETSRIYIIKGASDPLATARDELYDTDALHSSLTKRAWMFQEELLARRSLRLGLSRLFWECEHCRLSEDNCPQAQGSHV